MLSDSAQLTRKLTTAHQVTVTIPLRANTASSSRERRQPFLEIRRERIRAFSNTRVPVGVTLAAPPKSAVALRAVKRWGRGDQISASSFARSISFSGGTISLTAHLFWASAASMIRPVRQEVASLLADLPRQNTDRSPAEIRFSLPCIRTRFRNRSVKSQKRRNAAAASSAAPFTAAISGLEKLQMRGTFSPFAASLPGFRWRFASEGREHLQIHAGLNAFPLPVRIPTRHGSFQIGIQRRLQFEIIAA